MEFLKNIKRIATGRTESERRQIAAADIQIRRKALAAELREREKQSVRLSAEKVRVRAQAKIKQIRSPVNMFSSVPGGAYSSPFGRPKQLAPPKTLTPIVKRKKKKIKKKIAYSQRPVQQMQQKR